MQATDWLVEPAEWWVPDYEFTAGPEVVGLCTEIGYAPDPNQARVLDAIFAENERDLPAIFEVGVVAPRRNIKSSVFAMTCIGWLWLLKVQRVLYTAHEADPAVAEMFELMQTLIDSSPMLSRRVRRVYEGNGDERILFHSGAEMKFKTRTNKAGAGGEFDKILFDELPFLQGVHKGLLVPTVGTRPHAQLVYGGSAGWAHSEEQRELRERGLAHDPQLAWFRWGMPPPAEACDRGDECDHGRRTPGCGLDKPELLVKANPATQAGRLPLDMLIMQRRTMPPRKYGREVAGWWDAPAESAADQSSPIDLETWQLRELDDADVAELAEADEWPVPVSAFGIEMDLDRAFASIGAAGKMTDGRTWVEFVARGRGRSWVVPKCKKLDEDHGPAVFVVDGGGPAAPLIPDLEDAGLYVITAGTADVARACADIIDAVNDDLLAHGPEPQLDGAVEGARKRHFRDGGFSFGRRASDDDVTPLLGVTLAKWGLDTGVEASVFFLGDLDDDQGDGKQGDDDDWV